MSEIREVEPFTCDSCGKAQAGTKAPYVDRFRYDGRMCWNCFLCKLWLFDPEAPADITKLPGWEKQRDMGSLYPGPKL